MYIKAFTKWEDAQSRIASYKIEKKEAIPATNPVRPKPGLKAYIYDGKFILLPDFKALKPVNTKTVPGVFHTVAGKNSILWSGF